MDGKRKAAIERADRREEGAWPCRCVVGWSVGLHPVQCSCVVWEYAPHPVPGRILGAVHIRMCLRPCSPGGVWGLGGGGGKCCFSSSCVCACILLRLPLSMRVLQCMTHCSKRES